MDLVGLNILIIDFNFTNEDPFQSEDTEPLHLIMPELEGFGRIVSRLQFSHTKEGVILKEINVNVHIVVGLLLLKDFLNFDILTNNTSPDTILSSLV